MTDATGRCGRRRERVRRARPGPAQPGAAEGRGRRAAEPVLPGPGPGAALGRAAPAGRQDPGRRAGGGGRGQRRPADPAHALAGGRPDRPGDGRGAGLRPGRGGPGRAGPRHRAPAVRAQRGARARRVRRRVGRCGRLRGQRADAAHPDPAGAQDRRQRAEPDPGLARRDLQVPLDPGRRGPQVRRLPGGRGRVRLGPRRRPRAAALHRGPGHGLGRRRRLLGARRRGRGAVRAHRPGRARLGRRADGAGGAGRAALRRPLRRPGPGGAVRRPRTALLALPVVHAVRGFDAGSADGRRARRAQAADQRAGRAVRAGRRSTPPGPRTGTGRCAATPPTWWCRRAPRPRWRCSRRWRCAT